MRVVDKQEEKRRDAGKEVGEEGEGGKEGEKRGREGRGRYIYILTGAYSDPRLMRTYSDFSFSFSFVSLR